MFKISIVFELKKKQLKLFEVEVIHFPKFRNTLIYLSKLFDSF